LLYYIKVTYLTAGGCLFVYCGIKLIFPFREGYAGGEWVKPAYIIGGVVILAAIVFGALAFANNLTPYVTIAEARAADRSVQVHGYLKEALGYDELERFNFVLEDDQGDEMLIVYDQAQPANFEQATGFVVIGRYDHSENAFLADKILVKCPSKYQEQAEEYQDQKGTEEGQ
jgi:cytochrome c-type biogenesis protein CcmE